MKELWEKLPEWLKNYNYNIYNSNNYIVVDFETTTLDKGSPYNKDNSIVCSSMRYGRDHPDYIPDTIVHKGDEYHQQHLVKAIEKADFWVAHNSKFEYGWLERCGLPLNKTLAFCTQIAEYVLLSNRSKLNLLGLNTCLKRRGYKTKEDLGKKLLKAGVCPSSWPDRWLLPYSKGDVDRGEELFLSQRKALQQHNQLPVCFTRNIFTAPICSIEHNGMHLDADRVKILERNYSAKKAELLSQLSILTDGANPNSYPQMREVLYEKLKFKKPTDKKWISPKGELTTKFDYIDTLKPRTKKQQQFKKLKQEYSKVHAALSKSLTKFNNCVSETTDHVLTASLNQTITVTQRLSSTGKNYKAQFQNFPRIFKPLFSARHAGWEICEIDQAQLEYRVAVWYGQDEAGISDILNKVDAHRFTGEHLFGEPFLKLDVKSDEYKYQRFKCKEHTFKPLYGGQSGTKKEVAYYEAFKKKHVGITAAQNDWKMAAVNTSKVMTPSGLVFYFPGTRVLNDGYITNTTNICNYPVQSLATADIVPIGVTYQWHLAQAAEMQSYLINTIHDSSIGEVHPEEKELYSEIGTYAFVDVVYTYLEEVYGIDFNVPLEAEVDFNKNWSNSEDWEEKYLTSNKNCATLQV